MPFLYHDQFPPKIFPISLTVLNQNLSLNESHEAKALYSRVTNMMNDLTTESHSSRYRVYWIP